jgi:predicted enzyme related to lactoylglutathione lyase
MANPEGSFIWYDLMTPDADAAAAFYGKVVGWTTSGSADAAAGGMVYHHIVRSDGGMVGGYMGLTAEMLAGGAHPAWVAYLYVADVDAKVADIVADGGRVYMAATTMDGVGRFAMVTDPQGVPFYVMTPIAPAGREGEASDAYDRWKPQHFSWNELYTTDLEGAKAFYAKHFNFEFNSSMPMGDMGDYCFIDFAGEGIGAMMQKPPFVPVACWNYYIRVADIDIAKAAVEAAGGTVMNGPMEVPGGDWVISGMDPQGAAFSLVGAKEA